MFLREKYPLRQVQCSLIYGSDFCQPVHLLTLIFGGLFVSQGRLTVEVGHFYYLSGPWPSTMEYISSTSGLCRAIGLP